MRYRLAGTSMRSPESKSPAFVQPFGIVAATVLLGLLFFTMAMMDLRRLEGILANALRERARQVVEQIERSAQEKYNRLTRRGEDFRGLLAGLYYDDEAFQIQESLAGAIVGFARDMDRQMQSALAAGEDTQDFIHARAASEKLESLVFLDVHGRAVFQSSVLSAHVLPHVRRVWEGHEELVIHLFDGAGGEGVGGFVGVRRQDGNGAVLVVLSPDGLRYWGRKTCIEEAVAKSYRGREVLYLTVESHTGDLLARAGSVPGEDFEECVLTSSVPFVDAISSGGRCVKSGEVKSLELFFPFTLDGTAVGIARVGLETQETNRTLVENRRHVLIWTGIIVAVGLSAMGLLYRTQNLHAGRVQAMRERLYRAETLSSLGKLGASVAHEIRNPLNAISMATQRLQQDYSPDEPPRREEFIRITQVVRSEIRRLNGIVEEFLSLSRTDRLELREQSILDILKSAVYLIQEEAAGKNVDVQTSWPDNTPLVLLDANKFLQAVLNILRNALDAVDPGGQIRITLAAQEKSHLSITVRDDGAGIGLREQHKVFEDFYTTKQNGTGLGLSIAREIVKAHGGDIRLESEPVGGTSLELRLPWNGRKA